MLVLVMCSEEGWHPGPAACGTQGPGSCCVMGHGQPDRGGWQGHKGKPALGRGQGVSSLTQLPGVIANEASRRSLRSPHGFLPLYNVSSVLSSVAPALSPAGPSPRDLRRPLWVTPSRDRDVSHRLRAVLPPIQGSPCLAPAPSRTCGNR